jgi:hypothetical protein
VLVHPEPAPVVARVPDDVLDVLATHGRLER